MTDLFDIEREAQRLERHLGLCLPPEIELLVALKFFRLLINHPELCRPDSYLTQFLPRLASAAAKADPKGFFPDEAAALSEFAEWVRQVANDAYTNAVDAIAHIASASHDFLQACVSATPLAAQPPCHPEERSEDSDRAESAVIASEAKQSQPPRTRETEIASAPRAAPRNDSRTNRAGEDSEQAESAVIASEAKQSQPPWTREAGIASAQKAAPRNDSKLSHSRNERRTAEDGPVILNCLFVEHFPDLDLPPRGRLLKLHVTATAISRKAGADDIVVRNPVSKPDDRFLAQARDSVRAARAYMHRRYGLPLARRYRLDFAVDSSGARFTGDSLGVAFAAGAIAALGKLEVLRVRPAISPDVAFSGALSANGNLSPVDGDALKRKIDRAFFSRLKYLVTPRENITQAWTYLSELESHHPGRKLELVGADVLDAVAGDPRLVPGAKLSQVGYLLRKAWVAKRAPVVEVSVLVAAICFLLYLVLPARYLPWFDRNPAFAVFNGDDNSLAALNRDSLLIWSEPLQCKLMAGSWSQTAMVHDLDGDGMNEVLFMPYATDESPQRDWLYCFSADHQLRFKRYCAIRGQYPGDTAGVFYDPEHINVVYVAGKPVIITEVAQISPSRSHIRLWDSNGNPLGWYINAGGSGFARAKDLDADGREELLFLNYNIRMGCAALLVLDLDSTIAGVSPPYVDSVWDLSRVRRGNQAAYVLFPVTDLGREELANRYNEPGMKMVREDTWGQINVYVQESSHDGAVCAIYLLDRTLRLVGVNFTDQFRKRRDDLVREGRLPSVDWAQYADHARDSVLHWRDGSWVTEGRLRARSLP